MLRNWAVRVSNISPVAGTVETIYKALHLHSSDTFHILSDIYHIPCAVITPECELLHPEVAHHS